MTAHVRFKTEGDEVYMSPDDYLALCPEMKGNPVKDAKSRELRASVIDRDEAIRRAPSLKIEEKDGKQVVTAQDGRHRALLAKEHGIKLIPVRIDRG